MILLLSVWTKVVDIKTTDKSLECDTEKNETFLFNLQLN